RVAHAHRGPGRGDPGPPPAPDLRTLLPGRPRAVARDRRDGARPVDREARRPDPRRPGRGDERARAVDAVRGATAGLRMTDSRLGVGTGHGYATPRGDAVVG